MMIEGTYSYEQADELARTINAYWSDLGWAAGARPYVFMTDLWEGQLWGVKSDLVNGMPTKRETRVAA